MLGLEADAFSLFEFVDGGFTKSLEPLVEFVLAADVGERALSR